MDDGPRPGAATEDATGERLPPSAEHVRGIDLLLVILLTVITLFLIGTLIADPDITPGFILAMLLVQSGVPLAAVYVVIVRGRGVGWADIGVRPAPTAWYGRAAAIAVLTVPMVALINYVLQGLAGEPFRNPQIDLLAPVGFSWRSLVGMLIVAGVVAPIVEEIIFRGLLYGWLRRHFGVASAAVASGVTFGVAHGIVFLIPALAVQGIILAIVYERSGSLWPPIIVHGTFNMLMTIALYAALAAGVAPEPP